jgi:hypothetical protein
MHIDLSVS